MSGWMLESDDPIFSRSRLQGGGGCGRGFAEGWWPGIQPLAFWIVFGFALDSIPSQKAGNEEFSISIDRARKVLPFGVREEA